MNTLTADDIRTFLKKVGERYIALSKVARGLETDLEDVVFLLRRKWIALKELETMVLAALPRAQEFDILPREFRQHWETLQKLMRH